MGNPSKVHAHARPDDLPKSDRASRHKELEMVFDQEPHIKHTSWQHIINKAVAQTNYIRMCICIYVYRDRQLRYIDR